MKKGKGKKKGLKEYTEYNNFSLLINFKNGFLYTKQSSELQSKCY